MPVTKKTVPVSRGTGTCVLMMVVVMMVRAVAHRAVMMVIMGAHSPSPIAESAEGIDPRPAIVTVMRAGEDRADDRQYQNKDDEFEHCHSPFSAQLLFRIREGLCA